MNPHCEAKRNKKNNKEEQDDEIESTKTFQTLPPEIIVNVLSRLPISSLVQFKYTCRAWSMLAQDPNLLHDLWNSHIASQSNNNMCLIFHCDFPIRNHLYFLDFPSEHNSSSDYKQTVKRIRTPFSDSMPEYDLVGSCNGFLCLSDSLYSNSVYIYNPFKRDYIELPKTVHYPNQDVVYGFGCHSEIREYKVVKIIYCRKVNRGQHDHHRYTVPPSDVQIFTLGDSNWRSLGKVHHHLVQWPEPVLVNGRLHWLTKVQRNLLDCAIISLDLADEQFRVVPKPDHDDDEDDEEDDVLKRSCSHLMVLRGCLAAVFQCSNRTLEIWVMKEYDVKESWVMEFNIPIQMLQEPELEVNPCFKISKLAGKKSCFRVLCMLNKSEILLEYKSRVLIAYNPDSEKFRNVVFEGMPKWFQIAVHVGNFNAIGTFY
ncbi:hypothetical protein FEM48_Zijuj04G0131300 [Ziziphus jujuba var. spinosa]|uniref:F-box domain-containing protein n=1 Tax=Ziziphus jujuba var. spinosa TaxID=714518 RepID=A0A978VK26_ZIZJJ|nr:hypothetical protein FEM48_Zijuj04G0131300 [Ziziphus jujuba var. spinosa]